MGACATKSGDLKKVKGEPPLAVEDAVVAPPVANDGAEKADVDGVPAAAETTDQADVSRRRSLSDLLKEDAEASDGEPAGEEAVKVATEPRSVVVVVADELPAGAPASLSKEAKAPQQVAVVEAVAEQEHPTDGTMSGEEPDGGGHAQVAEEEKRVDPDSVQVATVVVAAAALSAEGSEVADGVSSSA